MNTHEPNPTDSRPLSPHRIPAQDHEATEMDFLNPPEDPGEAAATPEPHGIYWSSCALTISCFLIGVVVCIGHHAFYSHLDSVVVRSSDEQERNIRSAYYLL